MEAKLLDGRYQVLKGLGEGGMAKVWLVRDQKLKRNVALKTIKLGFDKETTRQQRFLREAKVCASLRHPNIISVFDFGKLSCGELFYTMEYIAQPSLRDLQKKGERFTEEKAIELAQQLAAALSACHQAGIVHRDVTAANVLIKEGRQVILADFGLVYEVDKTRLTETGAFIGTPLYLPPEVITDREIDLRSDIYQFGLVFHELLTGKALFSGDRAISEHFCQLMSPDFDPSTIMVLPDEHPCRSLLTKCLARDPQLRPTSMEDILDALRNVINVEPSVPQAKTPKIEEAVSSRSAAWLLLSVVPIICALYALFALKTQDLPAVEQLMLVSKPHEVKLSWRSQIPYHSAIHIRGQDYSWTSTPSAVSTCLHNVHSGKLEPNTEYEVSVIFPSGEKSLARKFTTLNDVQAETRMAFVKGLSRLVIQPQQRSADELKALCERLDYSFIMSKLSKAVTRGCSDKMLQGNLPFIDRVSKSSTVYKALLSIALHAQKSSLKQSDKEPACTLFLAESFKYFRIFRKSEDRYKKKARENGLNASILMTFAGRPRLYQFMKSVERQIYEWKKNSEKPPLAFEMLFALVMRHANHIKQSRRYAADLRNQILQSNVRGLHIDAILRCGLHLEASAYHKLEDTKGVSLLLDELCRAAQAMNKIDVNNRSFSNISSVADTLNVMSRTLVRANGKLSNDKILNFHRKIAKQFRNSAILTELKGFIEKNYEYSEDVRRDILALLD